MKFNKKRPKPKCVASRAFILSKARGDPVQKLFRNAQHFNLDREESHAEAINKSTGRPSAQSSEGAAAASSSDPRPASTKFFYPTLQPKDAKIGVGQPDAQTAPETNAKQSDWGDWDPEDNPAVFHGFSSRDEYEVFMAEFALAAPKKAIAEQIASNKASAEHPGITFKPSTGRPSASAPTFEQILPFSQAHVEQGGATTPAFSTIATSPTFTSGKKVADRINIGGWPTIKLFRQFKLVFKKAVAAASSRPDAAFVWISQIEKALTMEELCDSGEFPELDALLGMEWDKIISGEFQKNVRIKEYELSKDKMIKGRQVTWMVYDHFKLSDVDGAILSWDDIMRVELKMPGDTVKQFLNDWDTTCANTNNLPDHEFMESMFRKQLERSIVLKPVLALYWQGITQNKEPKDYKKLKHIVENHLEEQLLRRNQAALAAAPGPKQQMLPALGDGQVKPRNVLCK
jgi:hypothetical protein